jgi:hypothetical protein
MALILPSDTVELQLKVSAPLGAGMPSTVTSSTLSTAPVAANKSRFVTMGTPFPETLKTRWVTAA